MIKAVIFDVDGALTDTVDLHAACWVEALKNYGIEIPFEDMRVQIGKGGDQILHGLLPPDMIEECGEEISPSAATCSSASTCIGPALSEACASCSSASGLPD